LFVTFTFKLFRVLDGAQFMTNDDPPPLLLCHQSCFTWINIIFTWVVTTLLSCT